MRRVGHHRITPQGAVARFLKTPPRTYTPESGKERPNRFADSARPDVPNPLDGVVRGNPNTRHKLARLMPKLFRDAGVAPDSAQVRGRSVAVLG